MLAMLSLTYNFRCSWLACLIHLLYASTIAVASPEFTLDPRTYDGTVGRHMAAAQLTKPIQRRNLESALRYDHELHYLEGKSFAFLAAVFFRAFS